MQRRARHRNAATRGAPSRAEDGVRHGRELERARFRTGRHRDRRDGARMVRVDVLAEHREAGRVRLACDDATGAAEHRRAHGEVADPGTEVEDAIARPNAMAFRLVVAVEARFLDDPQVHRVAAAERDAVPECHAGRTAPPDQRPRGRERRARARGERQHRSRIVERPRARVGFANA